MNHIYIYIYNTHHNSSTNFGKIPTSINAWIFKLEPTERYDRAQHAFTNTLSSCIWISEHKTGNAHFIWKAQPKVYEKKNLHGNDISIFPHMLMNSDIPILSCIRWIQKQQSTGQTHIPHTAKPTRKFQTSLTHLLSIPESSN